MELKDVTVGYRGRSFFVKEGKLVIKEDVVELVLPTHTHLLDPEDTIITSGDTVIRPFMKPQNRPRAGC